MGELFKNILTDVHFQNALTIAIGFILLGFLLRKLHIFNEHAKNVLSSIVLKLAIPCLAFNAFMCDFNHQEFIDNLSVLLVSLFFYCFFLFVFPLLFKKKYPQQYKLYGTFIALGQLTLFSIPVLKTIYQNDNRLLIASNMVTLSFRIVLYTYAYFVAKKISLSKGTLSSSIKKIVLNPVMIAMLFGLFIYVSQPWMFQIQVDEKAISILRLDKTLPVLYQIVSILDNMTTPLAMLLIGVTLGDVKTKVAMSNKKAWFFAFLRSFIVPLIVLTTLYLLHVSKIMVFNEYSCMVLVLGFAAPLSAILNTFCVSADNEAFLSSDICFLSTLLSIISIPTFYVLVKWLLV